MKKELVKRGENMFRNKNIILKYYLCKKRYKFIDLKKPPM